MASDIKCVKHAGQVEKIENGIILVKIESKSACSGCHAKGACGIGDVAIKQIEVKASKHPDILIGDSVQVFISQKTGVFAVIVAYIVPLILLMTTLIYLNNIGISEPVTAVAGIITVVVYYIVLYALRNKINKKIKINIKK